MSTRISKKGVSIGQVQRLAEAAWRVLNHDNDPHDGQSHNTANWHALTRAIRAELEKQHAHQETPVRLCTPDHRPILVHCPECSRDHPECGKSLSQVCYYEKAEGQK